MLVTGQIVEVEVSKVEVFGIFCRHLDQEILVLIPDPSWIASFNSCLQFAEPGDRFIVKILNVECNTGRVAASVKALNPDPWNAGLLETGAVHQARVARRVEKADRCKYQVGYLLELVPGGFVMLFAHEMSLDNDQLILVRVCKSDQSRRAVDVVVA